MKHHETKTNDITWYHMISHSTMNQALCEAPFPQVPPRHIDPWGDGWVWIRWRILGILQEPRSQVPWHPCTAARNNIRWAKGSPRHRWSTSPQRDLIPDTPQCQEKKGGLCKIEPSWDWDKTPVKQWSIECWVPNFGAYPYEAWPWHQRIQNASKCSQCNPSIWRWAIPYPLKRIFSSRSSPHFQVKINDPTPRDVPGDGRRPLGSCSPPEWFRCPGTPGPAPRSPSRARCSGGSPGNQHTRRHKKKRCTDSYWCAAPFCVFSVLCGFRSIRHAILHMTRWIHMTPTAPGTRCAGRSASAALGRGWRHAGNSSQSPIQIIQVSCSRPYLHCERIAGATWDPSWTAMKIHQHTSTYINNIQQYSTLFNYIQLSSTSFFPAPTPCGSPASRWGEGDDHRSCAAANQAGEVKTCDHFPTSVGNRCSSV